MDFDGEDEDGEDGEEEEGMNGDGLSVGLEAAEVDVMVVAGQREDEARLQQHEEDHPNHHRRPVCHFSHNNLLPT